MRPGIFRYSVNNPVKRQSYLERPSAFLADLFTGVEERHEADHFSQYFVEEMVKTKQFPMNLIFPEVLVDQKKDSLETTKTRMEVSDDVLTEFGSNTVGAYLRTKIGVHIYGAPAFNVQFLVYKSGSSKMTITRKEHAYPLV